jgi:hypothetical protein
LDLTARSEAWWQTDACSVQATKHDLVFAATVQPRWAIVVVVVVVVVVVLLVVVVVVVVVAALKHTCMKQLEMQPQKTYAGSSSHCW